MSDPALLETADLTRWFGGVAALTGVSCRIDAGQRILLVGPNGAGKSTLLRLVAGMIRPSQGSLRWRGEPLTHDAPFRDGLGYVDHRSFTYDHLTGRENLRFFAGLYGRDPGAVETLLGRVGLAEHGDARVAGYSRGMRQRLSLARALLPEPGLLLADEPLTGLDEDGIAAIHDLLDEWAGGGPRTLIVASHGLEQWGARVDRLLVLDGGRLTAEIDAEGAEGDALRARYREALGR